MVMTHGSAEATLVADDARTLLAAPAGRLWRLDAERFVWSAEGADGPAEVDPLEAALLLRLVLFESVDAHVQAMSRALGTSSAATAEAITRLRARGLLWTPAETVGRPVGLESGSPPPPLIVIRTRERSDALSALMDSLLVDERRFSVQRRYLVIDDAPSRTFNPGVRLAVERFAAASRSEIRLLDATNRSRVLEGVAPSLMGLFDAEVDDRPSGARAWNLALMCGAGGTVGLLDDDFRFPLRRPNFATSGFDPSTGAAAATRWLDGAEPEAAGLVVVDEEPYRYLSRYLGRTSGEIVSTLGLDVEAARRKSIAALSGAFGPQRVTAIGAAVHGALNYDSSLYTWVADPATRAALLATPFDPRRLAGDSIWHGVTAPRLMAIGVFTPLLVDARELQPPTLPHGKADDSLFLALLPAFAAGVGYLSLPASIGHVDAVPRDRAARAQEPEREDLCSWLASLVGQWVAALPPGGAAARSRVLMAEFNALAEAPDQDLCRMYLDWREYRLGPLVWRLRQWRAELGGAAPPALASALDLAAAANETRLRDRTVSRERLAAMREACAALALALDSWPQLWASAGPRWLERIAPIRGR
jgi:hypothetical protein